MLKIKDDIDLKELEKYGFEEHHGEDIEERCYIDGYEFNEIEEGNGYLLISREQREIVGDALRTLYDLIQAGLVEKIEE